MTILADLVKEGAVLSMPDGYRAVLVDAVFVGRVLWFHEAFGREHMITADEMRPINSWLTYWSGGERVASIGSLEGEDDTEILRAWREHLATPTGAGAAEAITEMRSAALATPEAMS